jgi:outer membrane protein assembly factor BamB
MQRVGRWLALLGVPLFPAWGTWASNAKSDAPRLLWKIDTTTRLYTAGTLADINGDGLDEILLAGMNEVIAVNGGGKILWRNAVKERYCTYPAVLMRKGAPPLIFVADNAGNLRCLDGSGKDVWQQRMSAPANWSAAVVSDINADGKTEVIQTDDSGKVYAFDALTGKPLWQTALEGGIGASPSAGDLTGDGKPEVAVATEAGYLTVLKGNGGILWARKQGNQLNSAPVIFTAADGHGRIVCAGDGGDVFCVDANGRTLWRRNAGSPMDASISVGDLDLDGRADIFLVTLAGRIMRFDEDGNVIWTLDMQMRTDASGAIADVNGDGKLEYVLCTHKAVVLALNDAGDVLFMQQLPGVPNAYNSTPTFGDVTKSSPGREMVVCGGDSGYLFLFGTPAPVNAPLQWGAFRRDRTMVGSWPGLAKSQTVQGTMTPTDLAWNTVYCGQGIRFLVTNAGHSGQPVRAEATCVTPAGARHTATASIPTAKGELVLPVDVLAPGVYRVSWVLRSADGKQLAAGSREMTLQPFANDRSLAAKSSAALQAAADAVQATLPLSAAALRREARLLDDTASALEPLQRAAVQPGSEVQREAIATTAALVTSAQRGLKIAGIARQAALLGAGTSVIAFEGPVWESRGVAELLPEQVRPALEFTRRVLPGEHEPVAVNLLNVTNRELHVRVVIEAPEGVKVFPHTAFPVVTSSGGIAFDALPHLDETAAITIPSLSSRQLWLDIDTGKVAAGEHEIKVRLLALDGAGVLEASKDDQAVAPPETQVMIRLRVLPLEMAPSGAFRLCTWAYVESSQFKDIADATYEDLLAHGNNVFTVTALPEAFYDEQGRLTGPINYDALDSVLAHLKGKDVVVLLNGFPPLKTETGRNEYGSPDYAKALKPYLDGVMEHLNSLGFDRDHWALYPIDEAGGTGWDLINATVQFGKMVRAANARVQIYADAGGSDPAMMEAIAPYIDIWSPAVNLVVSDPRQFGIMKATGKTLWSYNCSYNNYNKALDSGRSLKEADIVSEYRIAGMWAFRHGLTGAGFWSSITSSEDPWTRSRNDYLMLYPGRTRPVTSRRWEAVREGIEDFRILAALKQRMEAAASALPQAARDKVQHMLETSLPKFIDGVTDEAGLDALQREMLDCVEAVAAAEKQ